MNTLKAHQTCRCCLFYSTVGNKEPCDIDRDGREEVGLDPHKPILDLGKLGQ